MKMNLIGQVIKEMKAHPFTMMAVLVLIMFAAYAQQDHARAEDVKAVKDQVDRILVLQLGEVIRSISIQICDTPEGQPKRVLERTLDGAQQEYRALTGTTYVVQDCPSAD